MSFRIPATEVESFRPTVIMKKIMALLRQQGEASARDLRKLGKSLAVDMAMQLLQEDGAIMLTKTGKKPVHTLRSTCTCRPVKKPA